MKVYPRSCICLVFVIQNFGLLTDPFLYNNLSTVGDVTVTWARFSREANLIKDLLNRNLVVPKAEKETEPLVYSISYWNYWCKCCLDLRY